MAIGALFARRKRQHGTADVGLEIGLFGLIVLILAIWAIFHVVQSGASPLAKAIWIVVVLFLFPPIGFLIWLLFGPRSGR